MAKFLIGTSIFLAVVVVVVAVAYVKWAHQIVLSGPVDHHLVGIFGDAMAPVAALFAGAA